MRWGEAGRPSLSLTFTLFSRLSSSLFFFLFFEDQTSRYQSISESPRHARLDQPRPEACQRTRLDFADTTRLTHAPLSCRLGEKSWPRTRKAVPHNTCCKPWWHVFLLPPALLLIPMNQSHCVFADAKDAIFDLCQEMKRLRHHTR